MQTLSLVHATALASTPSGAVSCQSEPFQRSAMAPSVSESPTAMHFDAVVQLTSASSFVYWFGPFGLGWYDHDVPFQLMTNVLVQVALPEPTALHAELLAQEMPYRMLPYT